MINFQYKKIKENSSNNKNESIFYSYQKVIIIK